MGMKELERSIKEAGKGEVRKIMREAGQEAETIRKGFEGEARKRGERILRDGRNEAELAGKRIIAGYKLRAKELKENRKNELIDEVFELARKKVLGAGAAERKRILRKLAEEGKRQVDDPVVHVDRKYARSLPGAKTADINDFGVIVRSGEGNVEIDNTLGSRLRELNAVLRHEIAEVLFHE